VAAAMRFRWSQATYCGLRTLPLDMRLVQQRPIWTRGQNPAPWSVGRRQTGWLRCATFQVSWLARP
jgi:hypothetical protein